LENANEGDYYNYMRIKEINVEITDPYQPYLTSVETMNWDDAMAPIKKAKSLTVGLSDRQKVRVIYEYVIGNVEYDDRIEAWRLL